MNGAISASGARVFVDANISVGETIYLRLKAQPHGGNIRIFDLEVIARVMHSAYSSSALNFELGLQFVEFKSDGKKQFADVIAHFEKGLKMQQVNVISEHE